MNVYIYILKGNKDVKEDGILSHLWLPCIFHTQVTGLLISLGKVPITFIGTVGILAILYITTHMYGTTVLYTNSFLYGAQTHSLVVMGSHPPKIRV
jgi:hypothetical protein